MNTKPEARPARLATVLQHVAPLLQWARRANAYVDEHHALPPDDMDPAVREELVAAMEELGELMQRYSDSLKSLTDREPSGGFHEAPQRDAGTAGSGTVLHLASRSHAVTAFPREAIDVGMRA